MPRPTRLSSWLWLLLAGLGMGTLFAFLGRHHWALDLFTHFRLQYAAGATFLLGLALALRLPRPAMGAGALLLANLPAVLYYFPARAPEDVPPTLRVVSFNVLTANPEKEAVLRYLQSCDADVIMIIEASREWTRALAPLEETHPYVVKAPRRDNFGLALYSRHPVRDSSLGKVEPFAIPILKAAVSVENEEFVVFGAHPLPPMNGRNWQSRNTYLTELGNQVRETSQPAIVMGDLNSTPWSPFFRDLVETAGLRDSGQRRGFQSTWQRRHPFFSIPIDHVLLDEELICTKRTIGPAHGSDHRPILVEIARKPR